LTVLAPQPPLDRLTRTGPGAGIRVALVTPAFAPQIGGVEVHVERLAMALDDLGCTVDVLTQAPRDHAGSDQGWKGRTGITITRFADVTRSRRFPIAPTLWTHLKRNAAAYDVVHAHSFHAAPALAASLLCTAPLVFTPHYHGIGHTPLARLVHAVYDPTARHIFAKATSVVCVSAIEAAAVRSAHPRHAAKVHVVRNGIDHDALAAADPYQVDRPIVLVVGRLEAYKQVDLAIEAVSQLDRPVELVVIGDGPERSRLIELAHARGVEDARFLRGVDAEELRRWQRTATVALTLSRHEAFGLVLAEGAAAGAKVVATSIPAHREVASLIHDDVTMVDVNADARQVRDAVERSLERPQSVDRSVDLPSWEAVGAEVLAQYEMALHRRSPAWQ